MHEMLANQYFLSRNWSAAAQELEIVHIQHPGSKTSKKKLIICYIELRMFQKALKLFYELVNEDIDFIMNTNLVKECCPCPDLIFKYENDMRIDDYDKTLSLSMLWLYCDIRKSLHYFQKLEKDYAVNNSLNELIQCIKTTISNKWRSSNGNKKAYQK